VDTLYEYMLDWSKGSKRRHLDGERVFIERYIRLDEFDALFGGKMRSTDRSVLRCVSARSGAFRLLLSGSDWDRLLQAEWGFWEL
jgi:hypothetical protein